MQVQNRRAEPVGPCNICGEFGKLTDDHVPPKSVLKPLSPSGTVQPVDMVNLTDFITTTPRTAPSRRHSPDGVKFRSLCGTCNSQLLGGEYDPAWASFVKTTLSIVRNQRPLPEVIYVEAEPNRVARSVVGHILAADVAGPCDAPVIQQLADYFLCPAKGFPANLRLYYWLYPFNDQLVINGGAGIITSDGDCIPYLLLKAAPLCFFIAVDEPPVEWLPFGRRHVHRLDQALSDKLSARVMLPLNTRLGVPQRWPEMPSGFEMGLGCDISVGAVPRL